MIGFFLASAILALGPPGGVLASTAPVSRSTTDLGLAPRSATVGIALTLRYRNQAELERLVSLQNDERSPLFGQWLSNEQFANAFAPTAADYARTIAELRRGGFGVSGTYANRTVVDVVGTVAAAERLFHTSIHRFRTPGGAVGIANVTPALAPASLRDVAFSVSGLATLPRVKADYARVTPTAFMKRAPGEGAGPPLRGPVSSVTGLSGFGPLAFSQGYNFPQQHGYNGSGRNAGIAIDADFLDSDLRTYLKYFNVTRPASAQLHRVPVDGGAPPGDYSYDSVETTLDVEALVSNAPGANVYVYEFPSFNNLQYVTDAYNKVVSDNVVDNLNSSFGGCEDDFVSDAMAWDHVALQGASKGITFHASSGDSGADPCGTGGNNVAAPASSPNFVAVGGTALTVDSKGNYVSEVVWNDGSGATGGGVSDVFPLPPWQVGVPNIIPSGRNLPDVSLDASPYTGIAFYYGGSWDTPDDPLGGTSLSSPLFGAALIEVDQLRGKRAGLDGRHLFQFFKRRGYLDAHGDVFFHAITSGCNGTDSPGYCANGSYSQATGIGTPDAWDDLLGFNHT